MMSCEYCHLELPGNAQYCGNCGHRLDDKYITVTDTSNPIAFDQTARLTPPPLSSQPGLNIQGSGMEWPGDDSELRTRWDIENAEYDNSQLITRNTAENEALLHNLLLPGMLAMQSQIPSPSQPPMVQGTPQFGSVPSVQGTPAVAGNVPQSIPGPAQGIASSAPPSAPQEAQSIPMQHQHMQYASYQIPTSHYQPVHPSKPGSSTDTLKHKDQHHNGSLHAHKSHSHKLHHSGASSSTKAGMSALSKWLIIAIVGLVIVGTSSVLLAHAIMPTTPTPVLSITGPQVVSDGGSLHVHGQGFKSGDGVALTVDNGLSVFLAGQVRNQTASNGTEKNVPVTGLSQMNITGMFQSLSSVRSNVTVSSAGTFDANVTVPSNLPAGTHTLHATDNQTSQRASLQFTISSSQLVVNPAALHFGSVEVGRSVKLPVTLSNEGGASLHWTATVEGSNTNWLTLSKNSDVLGTNGANETIIVTASTNGSSVGPRNATVHFHSENGDVLIAANIHVVSTGQIGQQAILNVSPQSLDFGQLQSGQQANQHFSIASLGNLPLQWQANTDAASVNWLSLATSSATIQPGAVPQAIQVNVDTSGLAAGSYSGTINITSNGGNAQVKVTLVVKGPPPMPTVTGINPASGPVSGGTTVTITGTSFTGAAGVSFGTTAASNVSVKSDTQITATSPAGSGTVDITVTTPAGTTATSSADQFTYITPLPVITKISPTSGTSNGGTTVTITGTGFTGATSAAFGSATTGNITIVSDAQITVTSPAGSGMVDVTITTPVGTSATSSADQFTYKTPLPTVTGLKPNSGPNGGGTTVTITGTGFNGATNVS